MIKSEADSRKKITLSHRQRDVLLFELLNSDLMLLKIKSDSQSFNPNATLERDNSELTSTKDVENPKSYKEKNYYWTLMDTHGNI